MTAEERARQIVYSKDVETVDWDGGGAVAVADRDWIEERITEAIAAAVAEERERCARIADGRVETHSRLERMGGAVTLAGAFGKEEAKIIAEMIRKG